MFSNLPLTASPICRSQACRRRTSSALFMLMIRFELLRTAKIITWMSWPRSKSSLFSIKNRKKDNECFRFRSQKKEFRNHVSLLNTLSLFQRNTMRSSYLSGVSLNMSLLVHEKYRTLNKMIGYSTQSFKQVGFWLIRVAKNRPTIISEHYILNIWLISIPTPQAYDRRKNDSDMQWLTNAVVKFNSRRVNWFCLYHANNTEEIIQRKWGWLDVHIISEALGRDQPKLVYESLLLHKHSLSINERWWLVLLLSSFES